MGTCPGIALTELETRFRILLMLEITVLEESTKAYHILKNFYILDHVTKLF